MEGVVRGKGGIQQGEELLPHHIYVKNALQPVLKWHELRSPFNNIEQPFIISLVMAQCLVLPWNVKPYLQLQYILTINILIIM